MRFPAVLVASCLVACAVPAAAHVAVPPEARMAAVPAAAPAAENAARYVSPAQAAAERAAVAAFGPFRVLDDGTAALVGTTDGRSPAAFQAMLEAYPHIWALNFIECPGTYDDRANLSLGRLIRSAGLAAIVPEGGSVRSGAVELVLAGASLRIEDGAEFAVHAWEDQDGREAADYPLDSIEHRKYLAYYLEMGMDSAAAAEFYAMTNSAPFEAPLWLAGDQMRRLMGAPEPFAPRLAYLDLGLSLY